jgi:hypothetical protein
VIMKIVSSSIFASHNACIGQILLDWLALRKSK